MTPLALIAGFAMASAEPVFVERPCLDTRLPGNVRCGTVSVAEVRGDAASRRLALNVVIVPASGTGPFLPPLFDLDGGPGLPASKNAAFYLTAGGAYRARRDVILVDQRGTGGSNPLDCPELDSPEGAYRPMLPAEAVSRCRESLAARADLRHYGTAAAVADLDEVRRALAHDVVDLFALSYGTMVALRYMAAHPGRVRAAVLMGTSPGDAMPPRHHAPAGQRALDLLFDDCLADAACRAAFPSPRGDLEQAMARLSATDLAADVFAEKLRGLLYTPSGARQLPWIISRAAQGDLAPFYEATRPRQPLPYSEGVFLSVTCAEGIRLMDLAEAETVARRTVFGDYRLRRQREACRLWPEGRAGPDHLAPVSTDAAVLLVSGHLDPVTPPEWADRLAAALPRARHVVLRHGGHVQEGLSGVDSCLDPMIVAFLETADPQAVDARCVETMQPPPFKTEGA